MPKATNDNDRKRAYGTEAQVADYLGLARITAQMRRLKGRDWPPAYKFGKRVMYRWCEVERWAESRKIGGAQ
jgi:hypothetical protein